MREKDDDLQMWSYWLSKYGVADALEYFPKLVASDQILSSAQASIRCAEYAIRARMKQLEDASDS